MQPKIIKFTNKLYSSIYFDLPISDFPSFKFQIQGSPYCFVISLLFLQEKNEK